MRNLILTALLLASTAALAQPVISNQVETVYSDAQRSADEDLSRRFITAMLKPSATFENQYAKWMRGVCPNVYGMTPTAKYVLEKRIRDVAQQVGARLDRDDPCPPNITIVVTPDPQASLESIASIAPWLVIGGKRRELRVTQPIQAWYTTFRRDYNGRAQFDLTWEDAATAGASDQGGISPGGELSGVAIEATNFPQPGGMSPVPMGGVERDIPRVRAQGTRLNNGITPEIVGAVILVDTKAIAGMSLDALGDYFALLALAPSPVTGRCQDAPTIANLMVEGCAREVKSNNLTNVDIAMLTGLYQTSERPDMLQKQRITGAMRRMLERQATGR